MIQSYLPSIDLVSEFVNESLLSEVKLRRRSLKFGSEEIEVLFTLIWPLEGRRGSLLAAQIDEDALENFKRLGIFEFVEGSIWQKWHQAFGNHAINMILNIAHSESVRR